MACLVNTMPWVWIWLPPRSSRWKYVLRNLENGPRSPGAANCTWAQYSTSEFGAGVPEREILNSDLGAISFRRTRADTDFGFLRRELSSITVSILRPRMDAFSPA